MLTWRQRNLLPHILYDASSCHFHDLYNLNLRTIYLFSTSFVVSFNGRKLIKDGHAYCVTHKNNPSHIVALKLHYLLMWVVFPPAIIIISPTLCWWCNDLYEIVWMIFMACSMNMIGIWEWIIEAVFVFWEFFCHYYTVSNPQWWKHLYL